MWLTEKQWHELWVNEVAIPRVEPVYSAGEMMLTAMMAHKGTTTVRRIMEVKNRYEQCHEAAQTRIAMYLNESNYDAAGFEITKHKNIGAMYEEFLSRKVEPI